MMSMEKTPYSFQERCMKWILSWLPSNRVWNKQERNQRFLEEALELVQSLDMTKDQAIAMVHYVFSRPKGEPRQEMGGVMNTLAILGVVHQMKMWEEADLELARCWDNISKIKEKNKDKPILYGNSPQLIIMDEAAEISPKDFDPLGR